MNDDPEVANIGIRILILLILTLVNAFFAGAEMAMVSVNKTKIRKLADDGKKSAQLVLDFLDEPTKFLSTIQVAITLAGFFSSASAATGLSKPLSVWLSNRGIPYGDKISFVGITLILSYFTLVFGELVPKRIALHKPEAFSLFCVRPIQLVSRMASPFIKLLTFSTNLVTKPFGMKEGTTEEMLSREDIKSLVKEGQTHGVLNHREREMIDSIMEFDDKMAKEIMTPRINVFAMDITDPLEEYLEVLLDAKYSRIPVYDEEVDNIIGILFIKDFLREAIKKDPSTIDLRPLLREPYFVPDSKYIRELFRELQQSKKQIAMLINEYGGFAGIVTMEDLVEEVMGDIEDEYDPELPKIIKLDTNTFLVDGLVTIGELNNRLDLDLYSENYDTISGFLIDQIGSIPKEKDDRTVEIDNCVFKLESVKNKRIDKVKLHIEASDQTDVESE